MNLKKKSLKIYRKFFIKFCKNVLTNQKKIVYNTSTVKTQNTVNAIETKKTKKER